jgi:hypothetical protein
MISFYKAKPDVSGIACSFQFSTKQDGNIKEGMFYCTLLRQTDWNQQSKTGSFVGSKGVPQDSCTIKFSFGEAAGIISSIRRSREFTFYHGTPQGVVKGNFKPYLDGNVLKGFSLSVDKDVRQGNIKERFGIGFLVNEAELLLIYLQGFIQKFYFDRDNEYQSRAEAEQSQPQPQRQPPAQRQQQPPPQQSAPIGKKTEFGDTPQDDNISPLDFSEDNSFTEQGADSPEIKGW